MASKLFCLTSERVWGERQITTNVIPMLHYVVLSYFKINQIKLHSIQVSTSLFFIKAHTQQNKINLTNERKNYFAMQWKNEPIYQYNLTKIHFCNTKINDGDNHLQNTVSCTTSKAYKNLLSCELLPKQKIKFITIF